MKQRRQLLLLQFRTNHTEHARHRRRAMTEFRLLRHHVKMQPAAVIARHDSLRPQHGAQRIRIRNLLQRLTQFLFAVHMRGLHAPAGKNLIRVVAMMMVVVMMVVAARTAILRLVVIVVPVMITAGFRFAFARFMVIMRMSVGVQFVFRILFFIELKHLLQQFALFHRLIDLR